MTKTNGVRQWFEISNFGHCILFGFCGLVFGLSTVKSFHNEYPFWR